MAERKTNHKAKRKLRSGRAASTAAGEFVREEIHHIRRGKHGARSAKQAIAIGLSKARRAGVPLKPPKQGTKATRESAKRAYEVGTRARKPRAPSAARSRATTRALRREPHGAATHRALSTQAHRAAVRRGATARSESARRAARTKGSGARRTAARRAATKRARNS